MSCKHSSMDNLPFHSQKHCTICGKSEQEIDLETKLKATEAALAESRLKLEVQTESLAEEREKREQAEARYTGLKDCFDEQCKITDDVLALAEKLEKRNNGLQTFIETKSGEEKDWLNGLGIVHDCGWRDTVSARIMHAEASCAAALPVLTAAREYDTICTQIHATTEPIPGYMLDVARKARLSLSEALMRMDAASSSAPAGEGAP